MGSAVGVEKTAASRIGVSVEVYRERTAAGLKHCMGCREWLPLDDFGIDRARYDGRMARCRTCRHVKKRRTTSGGPPDPRSAGLAIEAVRRATRRGELPPVRSQRCVDCGKPARHYHHHRGYDEAHRIDVVPVCVGCHRRRHLGSEEG